MNFDTRLVVSEPMKLLLGTLGVIGLKALPLLPLLMAFSIVPFAKA